MPERAARARWCRCRQRAPRAPAIAEPAALVNEPRARPAQKSPLRDPAAHAGKEGALESLAPWLLNLARLWPAPRSPAPRAAPRARTTPGTRATPRGAAG